MSLKVTGTDTDRSATYDFLLVIHDNHRPMSYRFRDKRRSRSKIPTISQRLDYFWRWILFLTHVHRKIGPQAGQLGFLGYVVSEKIGFWKFIFNDKIKKTCAKDRVKIKYLFNRTAEVHTRLSNLEVRGHRRQTWNITSRKKEHESSVQLIKNKNLCGRAGRTICGPAEKYMCVIVIR